MADFDVNWRPGSFTKNFSWGYEVGLRQLYNCIRLGFDNRLVNVPRELFRQRVASQFSFYIPANFFLFNTRIDGDMIIVDELVFQAITGEHGPRFDKLALFVFNFSYAGRFRASAAGQRRPAMWAHWYVRDRIAKQLHWNTRTVSADDIERFVLNEPRYKAQGARKLATNLNHLYKIGRLGEMGSEIVERWWVDALFLALDRLIADQIIDYKKPKEESYGGLLEDSAFQEIAGKQSLEKELATKHLLRLYIACGGRDRFSDEAVAERTKMTLADAEKWASPNDEEPRGAIHPSNPHILKSIPSACAMLAMHAGFEVLPSLAMVDFDPELFVRERTRVALERLKAKGVKPTMTAEEVLRLTRER